MQIKVKVLAVLISKCISSVNHTHTHTHTQEELETIGNGHLFLFHIIGN